jgi:hypothetical protein
MSDGGFRRLRAALRNAVAWGVAWAIAGGALVTAVGLFDPDPRIESLPERLGLAVASGVLYSVRFGIVGAVIGGVFSSAIGLAYRGRRVADISAVRFGLLGAVIGGVGVPLYLQLMNVLSGGPIAWGLVLDDGVWAAAFGGVAAAGSILLARRADRLGSGSHPDQLGGANEPNALPAAQPREAGVAPRSRSAQHSSSRRQD